ncbi:418_t:CDS:2, partial [Funneliformis geosporum]
QCLSEKQPIHFIPTDISDEAEYINGMSTYILQNYSSSGPRETPSFKTILAHILSTTLKNESKFGFENIRAFSLQGYHTEKKAYICVRT